MLSKFKSMTDRRSTNSQKRVSIESPEKLNKARVQETIAKRKESEAHKSYQAK